MPLGNRGEWLDFAQSYRKAADYCASQDRCIGEVKLKLRFWNIDKSFHARLISQLTAEGFIDEKRYAINFASGKFRINGWGKLKIAAALRSKSISGSLVQQAISSIDEKEYLTSLQTQLLKKIKQLGTLTTENHQKTARYAASKGFEPELILSCLKNIEIIDL